MFLIALQTNATSVHDHKRRLHKLRLNGYEGRQRLKPRLEACGHEVCLRGLGMHGVKVPRKRDPKLIAGWRK